MKPIVNLPAPFRSAAHALSSPTVRQIGALSVKQIPQVVPSKQVSKIAPSAPSLHLHRQSTMASFEETEASYGYGKAIKSLAQSDGLRRLDLFA